MIYNVERGALKLDFIQFDCKAEAYLEGFECNTFSKKLCLFVSAIEIIPWKKRRDNGSIYNETHWSGKSFLSIMILTGFS